MKLMGEKYITQVRIRFMKTLKLLFPVLTSLVSIKIIIIIIIIIIIMIIIIINNNKNNNNNS